MAGLVAGGVEDVGQAREQVVAGAPAVLIDQPGGALAVAARDRGGDRLVLVPERLALARLLQHRAHDAAQMHPVQLRAAADQRVAGGGVDRVVEGDVGFDHRA